MTEKTQQVKPKKPGISWKALEYEHKEKHPDWFWSLGVIVLAGAVTAIIFGNILFAILLVVGAFTLALYASRKPEHIYVTLSDRGVIINKRLYPYLTLDSFWVEDVEDHSNTIPKLILKSKKLLMPYIIIPVEEVSPDEVRDFLLNHLPEEEHEEPLAHRIMERLGF